MSGVFVVGGDATEPAGTFPDALSLLEALETTGSHFGTVGIGGHPEGHGHIDPELIERALERKAPHATHVITQLCFSAATTAAWARQVRLRGVDLPIRVGLPGAVTRQKLVRISTGLGLGQSARFLAKQQSVFWRFFLPHGYRPDRLVAGLAPTLGRPEHHLQGFHFFPFDEVARTEAWRQERLARLSDAGTGRRGGQPAGRRAPSWSARPSRSAGAVDCTRTSGSSPSPVPTRTTSRGFHVFRRCRSSPTRRRSPTSATPGRSSPGSAWRLRRRTPSAGSRTRPSA